MSPPPPAARRPQRAAAADHGSAPHSRKLPQLQRVTHKQVASVWDSPWIEQSRLAGGAWQLQARHSLCFRPVAARRSCWNEALFSAWLELGRAELLGELLRGKEGHKFWGDLAETFRNM